MRIIHTLRALVSEDEDLLQQVLDQTLLLDDTLVTSMQAGRGTLSISEADRQISFGGVTNAKYLVLLAYDAVQFRVNDVAGTLIDLAPLPATVATAVSNIQKTDAPGRSFLGPTNITSLYLTNPSITATASYYAAVIGEAS